ncbi:hypothetical protein [Sphingobacterium multivorum]|uniref:hypothetical protein n=1 Tax=Sphingobacterium multivorum TaxID=28454 RepID=UPI00368073BC
MIYLIDDNQSNQRIRTYNIKFVEENLFSDCLISLDKLKGGKGTTDISHLEFLNDADCILLHSTTENYDEKLGFLSGVRDNALKIKEKISQEGEKIPLVLFSNSMGEPQFEESSNFISSMKKNYFYERLYDFLQYYREKKEVELRILAFGKNFLSKELSRLAINILKGFEIKSNSEPVKLSDISSSSQLISFKKLIGQSFSDNDVNRILIDIEDNPITVNEFRTKINRLVESHSLYGKNIYNW